MDNVVQLSQRKLVLEGIENDVDAAIEGLIYTIQFNNLSVIVAEQVDDHGE